MPPTAQYADAAPTAEVDEKLDHFTPNMIGGVVEIQRKEGGREVGVLHHYYQPPEAARHLATFILGPSIDTAAPGFLYASAEPVIILRREAR